ncbi:hypothetical protein ILYODFUR_026442 [Ilyodon furcidens]|uniref:Uncharacterized protein n=1 Tax=Ilyodon furcidens TaxID=33524 RepID=A0ABV0VKB9_9TELE
MPCLSSQPVSVLFLPHLAQATHMELQRKGPIGLGMKELGFITVKVLISIFSPVKSSFIQLLESYSSSRNDRTKTNK